MKFIPKDNGDEVRQCIPDSCVIICRLSPSSIAFFCVTDAISNRANSGQFKLLMDKRRHRICISGNPSPQLFIAQIF